MGMLVFFPTDRYGSVTRNTEQPHPVERLAAWLRKAAHIRASASLGCEATLEQAPKVVIARLEGLRLVTTRRNHDGMRVVELAGGAR